MNACFTCMHRHNHPTSAMPAEAVASVCVREKMDSVCLTGSIFVIYIIIELVVIINSYFATAF